MTQPLYALSIRQPWAWLIVHGYKPIENRNWRTQRRGTFLIHASKTMSIAEYVDCMGFCRLNDLIPASAFPKIHQLEHGGIVGQAELVDCVDQSTSPWFFGKHGFLLANAKALPFQPCQGARGFFQPDLPAPSAVDPTSQP